MLDKVTAIAQLVTVLTQLAETEFEHVWNLIHAVKQNGVPAASINPDQPQEPVIPPVPKVG